MVSIVIPTYKRHISLQKLLLCLEKGGSSLASTEILVVDQKPESPFKLDHLPSAIRENTRYFLIEDFTSSPRARNFGIRKSKGDIIIFCDDDILPTPGFVERFYRYYTNKNVSGVYGRILVEKRGHLVNLSTRKEPGLIMPQVKSGFFSFRREILFKIGGFDEEYLGPALREESDLAARIIKAGGQVVYAPEITCIHVGVTQGGCHAPVHQRERLQIQNNFRYVVKNLSFGWFIFWIPLIFWECVLTRRNARNPRLLRQSLCDYFRYLFWALIQRREIKKNINYLVQS